MYYIYNLNKKPTDLLEPWDDGVWWSEFGVGDLDFDFGLEFSITFSLLSSLSDLLSLLGSCSSSDLEFASESDSVLELSSSVSVLECSPVKKNKI